MAQPSTTALHQPRTAPAPWPLPARLVLRLANSRELMLLVLILLLAGGMAAAFPNNFPTRFNVSAVLLSAAQNGILVAGMMLLMIAGVFDLSVGSTLALAGVWAGVVVARWGWPAPAGIAVGLAAGGIAGLVNGLIVTRLGINALITTLATMTIYRGLTYLTAGTGVTPIGDAFKLYGQSVLLGVQTPFWVMLAVVALGGWAVARTRFFRQLYFIGGNARRQALRHPRRAPDRGRLRDHGPARGPRRRAGRLAARQRRRLGRHRRRALGHHRRGPGRCEPEGRRRHDRGRRLGRPVHHAGPERHDHQRGRGVLTRPTCRSSSSTTMSG
jgi:hypothetical protein